MYFLYEWLVILVRKYFGTSGGVIKFRHTRQLRPLIVPRIIITFQSVQGVSQVFTLMIFWNVNILKNNRNVKRISPPDNIQIFFQIYLFDQKGHWQKREKSDLGKNGSRVQVARKISEGRKRSEVIRPGESWYFDGSSQEPSWLKTTQLVM